MKSSQIRVKDSIGYLSSVQLDGFGEAVHAFLSRRGGVSAGEFATLNFDTRDGDAGENVRQNKSRAGAALGAPLERLINPTQVHGNFVVVLDSVSVKSYKGIEADAVVTNLPGVPVGILTADCLPVLLYDPVKKVAGAAHAGWRGTLADVCGRTVEAMKERFGTIPKDIIAALGPHIKPCCYAVNNDIYEAFEKAYGGDLPYFSRSGETLMLDIGGANRTFLLAAGLREGNITDVSVCTSCNVADFYSYRKEGGKTGRQLSFIMLKG